MPRSFNLHPFSLLAGGFVVSLILLSMSEVPVLLPRGANIEYVARPQDMVQIKEGTPFVVPTGKVLVPTALGTNVGEDGPNWVEFLVNGTLEGSSPVLRNPTVTPASMSPLSDGESVQAGATVTIHSSLGGNAGRLWGYLTSVGTSPVGSTDTVRVPYRPHPRDLVQIAEGQTYTVPNGMLFVLTALGGTLGGQNASPFPDHALLVDGVAQLASLDLVSYLMPAIASVPTGFTVAAGSTIEVTQIAGAVSPGRAWGYLVKL